MKPINMETEEGRAKAEAIWEAQPEIKFLRAMADKPIFTIHRTPGGAFVLRTGVTTQEKPMEWSVIGRTDVSRGPILRPSIRRVIDAENEPGWFDYMIQWDYSKIGLREVTAARIRLMFGAVYRRKSTASIERTARQIEAMDPADVGYWNAKTLQNRDPRIWAALRLFLDATIPEVPEK